MLNGSHFLRQSLKGRVLIFISLSTNIITMDYHVALLLVMTYPKKRTTHYNYGLPRRFAPGYDVPQKADNTLIPHTEIKDLDSPQVESTVFSVIVDKINNYALVKPINCTNRLFTFYFLLFTLKPETFCCASVLAILPKHFNNAIFKVFAKWGLTVKLNDNQTFNHVKK